LSRSLGGANLQMASLPDGTNWTPDTGMARFTDPEHPEFWRSDDPGSPAYRGMDGYQVLDQMKANSTWRNIPVIVVLSLDEMESILRCIEMGATDYLPKPFDAALLHARIGASLASKRLHNMELEYIEQVGHVTRAAAAMEAGAFELDSLNPVARRDDSLGQLERVFKVRVPVVQHGNGQKSIPE
jgi:DNA-binding NtrC family response regulator